MTKKHFMALARALSSRRPENVDTPQFDQWVFDVYAIADACEKFNDNFDRMKFREACLTW